MQNVLRHPCLLCARGAPAARHRPRKGVSFLKLPRPPLFPLALNLFVSVNTILFREYGKQADMWSVGVVSYVVLSGAPAFPGDDLDDKVSRAEFTPMTGKRWANKSDAAKAFVRALLVVSVKTRLTAEQAVGHPWIAGSAWLLPPPEQPKSKKRSAAAVDGGGDSDRGSVSHAGGVAAGSEEGSGGR